MQSGGIGRSGYASAAVRVGSALIFVVLPLALTVGVYAAGGRAFAYDFHQAFWPAAHRVLAGDTPYVEPTSQAVTENVAFIYPAVAALFLAPVGLLGRTTADHVAVLLNLLCGLGTLWILRVRDYRLYGLVLASPALLYAWHLGNVSLPLALGVAAVWRWRDRPLVAGLLVAVVVSIKLYLWPLGLWLLATRRYRSAACAAVAGLALNAVSWLALGVDQLSRYEHLLRAATRRQENSGYSLVAVAMHAGSGRTLAYAFLLGVTVALCVSVVVTARRGGEAEAMAVCVAVCLAASPILWLPYFSLLLVPLAILRPSLSPVWLWLVVPWLCPEVNPSSWQIAVTLVSASAILVTLTRRAPATPRALDANPLRRARRALSLS